MHAKSELLVSLRAVFLVLDIQDGIEECRKLCGGHGYLCNSGLPELYAVYVPACTYEGDNTILLLQVDFLETKIWTMSEDGYVCPYQKLL